MEFEHYAIDTALSSLTLRAFASAAFAALENSPTLVIREFAGWVRFAARTFDQACVQLMINAGSLTVAETMNEKDRVAIERMMRREVLEVERYPEIIFCSSRLSVSKAGGGQYWINLVGDLSLHGITGTLPVAAQVALVGNTLRAHGEFTVLQTSYKMKLAPVPAPVPGGTLKLKDEVKCSFNLLARKQTDLAPQEGQIFAAEGL